MTGWHSANEIGSWDDAEVQPYERTAPAPPRSDRRDESDHDERSPTRRRVVFLGASARECLSPAVCVSARISPWERLWLNG
jgi:hypothetical protein